MAVRKTKKGLALKRWFKEKWRTPRGKKTYSGKDRTFRPTKRVSSKTPSTWSELVLQRKEGRLKKNALRAEYLDIRSRKRKRNNNYICINNYKLWQRLQQQLH